MSDTKPALIKQANNKYVEETQARTNIINNIRAIAESVDTSPQDLHENVTHVLANIATTTQEGLPLKLMHTNAVAAFMAGVESLAKALPTSQDTDKVQNAIRYLQAVKVGPDGFVTTATAPIAQLGARKNVLMSKYAQLVNDYIVSQSRGQPNGEQLALAARQLQQQIDQAMRQAANPPSVQTGPAAPSTPMPHQ